MKICLWFSLINFDKMSTEIKFSNLSVDEILQIVEPIMDNCLEGSNEGNYEKHKIIL